MDAKRINLFIGKPNVGKSNILEGLSLLGAPYEQKTNKYLSSFIRYEDFDNLFFDRDLKNMIEVKSNIGVAYLRYHFNNINAYDLILGSDEGILKVVEVKSNLHDAQKKFSEFVNNNINENENKPIKPFYKYISATANASIEVINYIGPVKKYDFQKIDEKSSNKFPYFLLPADGANLFFIVYGNKKLNKQITPLFEPYDLNFVLKVAENKFEIQKNIDGLIYSYPYTTIADTLQRFIFYIAAIESNKDSVLLLEEPEVHSFPPYTQILADKISKDTNNQYFITTHSPYLLQTIISNTAEEDLNVFITYFENFETKVRVLTHEELRDILDDSIDIFFNLDRFLSDASV